MKILIIGSKGMLAKAVIEKFKIGNNLTCIDKEELDITDKAATLNFIAQLKPDCIINCAAYTAVDKAEEEKELARQVNAVGPLNISIAAKEANSIFVHISTDYVFDGSKELSGEYTETDETNPITVYGDTKAEGEKYVIENCTKYYIYRTAWLYGDGNNFVRTMVKLGKEKEEVNVVDDQYGSPTYTEDLADIIKQAIDKKIPYGIYHATNLGFTTWYEFTKDIFQLEHIECKVNPVTSKEFIRPAKRPNNSKLSKEKILKEGIIIPEYRDALKRFLKKEGQKNEE